MSQTLATTSRRSRIVKVSMPSDLVAGLRLLAEHEGSSGLAPTMRRLVAIGLRSEMSRWQDGAQRTEAARG
jgi:hypothetical protein